MCVCVYIYIFYDNHHLVCASSTLHHPDSFSSALSIPPPLSIPPFLSIPPLYLLSVYLVVFICVYLKCLRLTAGICVCVCVVCMCVCVCVCVCVRSEEHTSE